MTTLREAAQQALEALAAMTTARCGGDDGMDISPINAAYDKAESALTALKAALAQQAEPVAWEGWWLHHGQHNYRAKPLTSERVKELMKLAFEVGREAAPPQQAEPVDTDCHTQGICQRSGYGIGKQADPQIEDRLARHGINPCPDCRGIGYDASGQLCWCQQNPSF